MSVKALEKVAKTSEALDTSLESMAGDLSSAASEIAGLTTSAELPDLCGIWKSNQAAISKAIEFLQNGKVKILFFSVSLPKFLKSVGQVLKAIDTFLGKVC